MHAALCTDRACEALQLLNAMAKPLTLNASQVESTMKMQSLQPQVKALQDSYKGKPQDEMQAWPLPVSTHAMTTGMQLSIVRLENSTMSICQHSSAHRCCKRPMHS